MDTKLTLKLDEDIIKRAKKLAQDKQTSLSRMIENYLDVVTRTEEDAFQITPFVKSISTGIKVPNDLDYQKEYANHLSKKHQ